MDGNWNVKRPASIIATDSFEGASQPD